MTERKRWTFDGIIEHVHATGIARIGTLLELGFGVSHYVTLQLEGVSLETADWQLVARLMPHGTPCHVETLHECPRASLSRAADWSAIVHFHIGALALAILDELEWWGDNAGGQLELDWANLAEVVRHAQGRMVSNHV